MRKALLVLVTAWAILPTGPARADAREHTITSVAYLYVMPETRIAAGDHVWLHNLDRDLHTVTARDERGGRPLFDTPLGVPLLGRSKVEGVEHLAPGIYRYFCRLHPTVPTMFGRIIVV